MMTIMNVHYIFMIHAVLIVECTMESKCRILSHKDECGNQGWLWDCSGLNLEKIPREIPGELKDRKIMLDLSQNNFTLISRKTFRGIHLNQSMVTALYFSHNNLKSIQKDSFKLLNNLCVLEISSCNLSQWSFKVKAFSSLRKLKILIVNNNSFTGYPENEIISLSSLEKLCIDVFVEFRFKQAFKRLKKLRELKLYSKSHFHIHNYSFNGLSESPIQYLEMNFKRHVLCDISEEIFCSFPYLKGVEIFFGGLCDMNVVMKSLKCLQNRTMEYIVANENFVDLYSMPFYLNKTNTKYLYSICFKSVSLINDRILGILASPQGTNMGNCMEYFNVGRNRINLFLPYLRIDLLQNFPKLRFIDASYHGYMNVLDDFNNKWLQMLGWKANVTITIDISKNLQYINYADNYFHNIKLKDPSIVRINVTAKSLQELNLSNTNFPLRYIFEADTPNLEVLDITGSLCRTVSVHLFEQAIKLKKIVAENIKLNFDKLDRIFYSLKNLEELDVHKSNLRNIPLTLLKYQTFLFRLNLDENLFSSFPATLKYVPNLEKLYIRFNKITSITESDFITFKRLRKTKIYVHGNPINCDCLHVQSLRWMREIQHLFADLNETFCSEKSLTVLELLQENSFEEFEKKCQTETWLAISVLILLILIATITVVFLAKKYRVHIDYVILNLRNRWKGVYSVESGDFQFDAFISYAEDDYRIVSTTLYQTLTKRGFQISFPDKDFIPGISKADELLRFIDKSRKVVFIVTENFLANGWNSYAVQMAVTHSFHTNRRQTIIVIIKDDITIKRMPKDLRYIWWSIVSIRWPETSELMDQFWDELDCALKSV